MPEITSGDESLTKAEAEQRTADQDSTEADRQSSEDVVVEDGKIDVERTRRARERSTSSDANQANQTDRTDGPVVRDEQGREVARVESGDDGSGTSMRTIAGEVGSKAAGAARGAASSAAGAARSAASSARSAAGEAVRRTARSSEERRARSELAGRHELIDESDVVFVERDGRTVAIVDDETADLLGRAGFDPDAELVDIRTGQAGREARETGGAVGETGGGEDFLADLDFSFGEERRQVGGDRLDVEAIQEANRRAETQAERAILSDLEEQYGVDLGQGDVTYTRKGQTVTGRLSESGRREVAVETAPVVQALGGTTVGDEARAAAGAAFDFRQFQRRQQARVDAGFAEVRETLGITEEVDAFNEFRGRQQARVEGGLDDARRLLNIDSQDLGTGLVTLGAAGVVAPEPVTSVVGGGAVVVGGTILAAGAGAAAVQEAVQSEPLDRIARAEVPGLFSPEQDIPTRPAGNMFVSEKEVEPSSLELPELLPPTTGQGELRTGRRTPPELAVPAERAGRTPPELGVPEEPAGQQPAELEVPTAQTQQAIQRGREVSRKIRRSRERRGRVDVPSEFIPEGTVVIGEEVSRERATGGGAMGITVGPNPRSTELRRIETPYGGFRVDAELTRFLEAQERNEQVAQPEVEAAVETGEGTPGESVPGLFGLGIGGTDAARRRREAAEAPFTRRRNRLLDLLEGSPATTRRPDQELAARQRSRLALLTGTGSSADARAVETPSLDVLADVGLSQGQRTRQEQRVEQVTGQRTASRLINQFANPPAEATAEVTEVAYPDITGTVDPFQAETATERPARRDLTGFIFSEPDPRGRTRARPSLIDRTFSYQFRNPLATVGGSPRRRRDDDLAGLFGAGPAEDVALPGFELDEGDGDSSLEKLLGGFV